MSNQSNRITVGPAEPDIWYGWGSFGEADPGSAAPGCRHVYETIAMLDVSACGEERTEPGLNYIREHSEINQVVLTGTDGLSIPSDELDRLFNGLRGIGHIGIIRLSTRLPVTSPDMLSADTGRMELIRLHSSAERRIYVTAYVNSPDELTEEAGQAFRALQEAGAIVVSHTPILRGVNDSPEALAELLDRLPRAGVTPYSLFLARPRKELRHYAVPIEEAYRLAEEAKLRTSGLGKRVRLSIDHHSGDIEILAVENGKAYLKYHRARDGRDGKFIIADCPADAEWFDELPDGSREEETMAIGWVDDDADSELPVYNIPASRHYFTEISD